MSMTASIAAMSMSMSSSAAQQNINIAVLSKTLDASAEQGAALVQDLRELPTFNAKGKLDVYI